jgi:hypothetical protein
MVMNTLSEEARLAVRPEAEPVNVLILPGWQGSGPGHWQMLWAQGHGYTVVEQNDWCRPRRGDWLARLDEVIGDAPGPVVLVAHSLGCILVAAWASFSRHTARVQGALLVAPGDVEALEHRERLPGWAPIVRLPLPFPSILVGSQNDPHCSTDRAQEMAENWGSQWLNCGPFGHLNADASLGDWPQGHALLQSLLKE